MMGPLEDLKWMKREAIQIIYDHQRVATNRERPVYLVLMLRCKDIKGDNSNCVVIGNHGYREKSSSYWNDNRLNNMKKSRYIHLMTSLLNMGRHSKYSKLSPMKDRDWKTDSRNLLPTINTENPEVSCFHFNNILI